MTNEQKSGTGVERILVGLDAEGLADEAVLAGIELSRRLQAKLELVHAVGTRTLDWEIVEDPRSAASNAGVLTTAWRAMEAHVRGILERRGCDGSQAAELIRVLPGSPAKVLLERARDLDADLIVLGAHKKRGVIDFGSTIRAVLARAPKAVWVQPRPWQGIRSVLVPVDLSDESLLALSQACALARAFDAGVRAVHCFQGPTYVVSAWPEYPDFAGAAYSYEEVRAATRAAFDQALAAFDWQGSAHEAEFVDGDAVERILELSRGADLIAMGTHGRTGLSSVLLGNVAYAVLRRSEKPVLALRHPERSFLT